MDRFIAVSHAYSRPRHTSVISLAAYRAGASLRDDNSGHLHNFAPERTRVMHDELIQSPGSAAAPIAVDRPTLWNHVQIVTRGTRACLAREIQINLPAELSDDAKVNIARQYAQDVASRYQTVVDLAVHRPRPSADPRAFHAHLLMPVRTVGSIGLGDWTDLAAGPVTLTKRGQPSREAQMQLWSERWVELGNAALQREGLPARMSTSKLDEFGLLRPTPLHVSRAAYALVLDGKPCDAMEREQARRDFELRRYEADLKQVELELHKARLLQSKRDIEAGVELDALAPANPDYPTDHTSWLRWRAQQTFDLNPDADAWLSNWLELRRQAIGPADIAARLENFRRPAPERERIRTVDDPQSGLDASDAEYSFEP